MTPAMMNALCQAHGLPEPMAEFKFCDDRKFKFDWAWVCIRLVGASGIHCHDPGIALEIEGGMYGKGKPCPVCKRKAPGAHTSIERLKSDMEKYNEASIRGWRLIRCRPEQIESGEAFALVRRAFGMPPQKGSDQCATGR